MDFKLSPTNEKAFDPQINFNFCAIPSTMRKIYPLNIFDERMHKWV